MKLRYPYGLLPKYPLAKLVCFFIGHDFRIDGTAIVCDRCLGWEKIIYDC